MPEYALFIESCIGDRNENQDYYLTQQTPLGLLIVMCDGMGGTYNGKIAAEIACQTVIKEYALINDSPVNEIKKAIETANTIIYHKGKTEAPYRKMGTTLAALLIEDTQATFFHAGDSRIYQIRNGNILLRTTDHSKVAEMVRQNILTEEEARISFESNIIMRALGISPEVTVEITTDIQYQPGDRFAICTDGVWNMMPEEKLVKVLSKHDPVEQVVNNILDQINTEQLLDNGQLDNMTLALIEIK